MTTELTAAERKQQRRRRRWVKRFAVTSVLAGLAAGAWAFEQNAGKTGLSGLLPKEVPAELSADAFTGLGENWTEWNATAIAAIEDFYQAEGDIAAQRAALANLRTKLGVLNKAVTDNKYSMIREPLISLRGPLARRIAVAEAILDTLESDPRTERGPLLQHKTDAVKAALSNLKRDLSGISGGTAWLPFIKAEALEAALQGPSDSDEAVSALRATQDQLAKRESLTDSVQKEFLSRASFQRLDGAIGDLLNVAARPAEPLNVEQLRPELARLVAALEDYEATTSAPAAAEVRASLKAVQNLAGSGSTRLLDVITEHYFNDNVRIAASERFLSRLLADARVEQGQVRDFILGANVGGWQTTATNVSVDLKPSRDRIRFDLVLSGTVQSNTAGATSQATIYTSGYHVFNSTKEITFDGYQFTTAPALIAVNANNTTTGATTRLSRLPIFGRIADRVAIREAGERRPQSEAIARSRVAERVLPRFNQEVNSAFAEASRDIDREFAAGLKAARIYPDHQHYSSTDNRALISTRLMQDGKLGGNAAEPKLLEPGHGAALSMHESAVNNTIDEMNFNGKTMSEEELRHHIEQFLSTALSREVKFRTPEQAAEETPPAAVNGQDNQPEEDEDTKGPAKLMFAQEDPIRVQFRNGVLNLVIRAGLERENQDPIPLHEITVPLMFKVQGDQIVITRDNLRIAPIEGRFSPVQQKVMNTRISAALPERTVSAKFNLEGPRHTVVARVRDITLVDGWIAVQAE